MYVCIYIYIHIRIFVLIMYTAHQCQSKWTNYSARLRSAHHSSASVAVALVCCTARANLSLVRCMPSAAVVAQNIWTLLRVLARKLVLKKIYIHMFLGGLSWVGLASGTCQSSCLQINQTLGKRSSRGGVKIPGGFFFLGWLQCKRIVNRCV